MGLSECVRQALCSYANTKTESARRNATGVSFNRQVTSTQQLADLDAIQCYFVTESTCALAPEARMHFDDVHVIHLNIHA